MAKVTSAQKVKKKKFFEVVAPEFLKGTTIGEALSETTEGLIGKTIVSTAGEVLGNAKKYINIRFKISEVKTSVAHTVVDSITVSAPYIQRKVKHDSKVDTKCVGVSKDGKKVGLLISAIAQGRCFTTAKSELRKVLQRLGNEAIKNTNSDALIIDLLSNMIQNDIRKQLHKIYPVRSVELEKITLKEPVKTEKKEEKK
ncbi:30S ribosomal protein S3Ae [Candidatus Tiddalikarchaeum anstoanum]|nr:30S ribosomal protein S3Ae [Candidatus Tiddalikarchaeum anstoanum]